MQTAILNPGGVRPAADRHCRDQNHEGARTGRREELIGLLNLPDAQLRCWFDSRRFRSATPSQQLLDSDLSVGRRHSTFTVICMSPFSPPTPIAPPYPVASLPLATLPRSFKTLLRPSQLSVCWAPVLTAAWRSRLWWTSFPAPLVVGHFGIASRLSSVVLKESVGRNIVCRQLEASICRFPFPSPSLFSVAAFEIV